MGPTNIKTLEEHNQPTNINYLEPSKSSDINTELQPKDPYILFWNIDKTIVIKNAAHQNLLDEIMLVAESQINKVPVIITRKK